MEILKIKSLLGKIIEINAGEFKVYLLDDNDVINTFKKSFGLNFANQNTNQFIAHIINIKAKGNLKLNQKLVIGDNVILSYESGEVVISSVVQRTNLLVKPLCANIDTYLLILATVPKPNYKLVDLLLALCFFKKIEPIICINKIDLDSEELIKTIHKKYDKVCKIFEVSAVTGKGLDYLKKELSTTTAVCGQSAVGKSSILNKMFNLNLQTGELSSKIERGKNTTVKSYFYIIDNNKFIIDTPGFSFVDINKLEITKYDLINLFPDFKNYSCKFRDCSHNNIEGCMVEKAVREGNLDKERVDNFIEFYNKLKSNLKEDIKK